ncbi:MAG: response regulator [Alphaproteobacteria bacterium]
MPHEHRRRSRTPLPPRKLRALIVEDDMQTQKAIVNAFKRAGFEVTACPDFASAKAALEKKSRFDVLITDGDYCGDKEYPGMGSLSLLKLLKKEPGFCPLITTMITGEKRKFERHLKALGDTCVQPELYEKDKVDFFTLAQSSKYRLTYIPG